MKNLFYKTFLALYLVSLFSTGFFAFPALAEVESCDVIAHSHQEGNQCICDSYYKAAGGSCVPMSEKEICPGENSHQSGDLCVCDEGYGAIKGVCYSKAGICANNHATYDASIDDCKCNKGYKMNATDDGCLPVTDEDNASTSDSDSGKTEQPANPPRTEPSTNIRDAEKPLVTSEVPATPPPKEPSTNMQDAVKPPVAPVPPVSNDPAQLLLQLKDDPSKNVSNDPFVDAGIKGLSTDENNMIQSQKDAVKQFSSDGEYQIPPDENQLLNNVKGVLISEDAAAQNKYEQDVKRAEQEKILKNPSDQSKYDDLQRQKEALAKQIQSIQDANNIVYKQSIQIMLNEQTGISALYYGDQKFQEAPKRDYMKESGGDPGMALVYANQAVAANKKLLDPIKENLRQINQEQHNLLKLPDKPVSDLENKLKNINPNWYKTK